MIASFEAHNNVISSSQGIWTNGTFSMKDQTVARFHNDGRDTYSGSFGVYGIFRAYTFHDAEGEVREEMGLHSGRSNNPSANTEGCIRTTDEAMAFITQQLSMGYYFTSITVQD